MKPLLLTVVAVLCYGQSGETETEGRGLPTDGAVNFSSGETSPSYGPGQIYDQLKLGGGTDKRWGGSPRIFIPLAQDGYESYLSAAIVKKHVPAVVTTNRDDAHFVLTSAVVSKEESGASKIARCLFVYCIGITGTQTATIQLVNADTQQVDWAYNVRKMGASNFQSSAEACAKHLKKFLEQNPR